MYKQYESKEKIICNPEYPDHQVNLGLLMKERRAALKITQGDFADMMNVTRNTIINWESNKSKPDYNMLPKICTILDIKLNDIFGLSYEAPPTILEQHVIRNLRALSPYGQRVIEKMSDTLVEEEAAVNDQKIMKDFE